MTAIQTAVEVVVQRPSIEQELVAQTYTDAQVLELSNKYGVLKINGSEDKKGYLVVRDAIKDVKRHAALVEEKRKEIKKKYVEAIDGEGKRINGNIGLVLTHLENQEAQYHKDVAKALVEAEKAEIERADTRMALLREVGVIDASFQSVKMMSDSQFASFHLMHKDHFEKLQALQVREQAVAAKEVTLGIAEPAPEAKGASKNTEIIKQWSVRIANAKLPELSNPSQDLLDGLRAVLVTAADQINLIADQLG